ncbi:Predicted dehydrogenase [alpha proteobacterium BAL199]|jgi:phosphoglycerate dehydrogenase-like enzyme|nr:Predicted dehydrogenase [alpha proteobacterium BAL199]
MTAFRVGLSADFTRADGKPTFPSYDLSPLAADGAELVPLAKAAVLSAEQVAGFDAIVLLGERMVAHSFPTDGRLALIARMGVGYDTIDTDACTAHDVALTITPDAVRRPMASAQVCFILALTHKLVAKDRIARTGTLGWPARIDNHGMGLVGRTIGSVGVGNIGAEMFKLLKAFDVRMIAHDPYADAAKLAELGIEPVSLEAVFEQSDVVTFNCPLNAETKAIGSAKMIARMKPTAYLVNTSRGPVVDQKALYDALVTGRIAGAAIDVFDPEPPAADEPILRLDSVLTAPHSLGWTDQMFATMGDVNRSAIADVKAGRAPSNVVNRAVLDHPGFKAKLTGR